MTEPQSNLYFVLSPIKLDGAIAKPSPRPVAIPPEEVEELLRLGLISEDGAAIAAVPAVPAGANELREVEGGQQLLRDIELQILGAIERRDQAEREAAAAEARRDAAIAEAEKAENPRFMIFPNGSPIDALLGSDKFAAQVRIGDAEVALGDLVAQAVANSLLDAAAWNALSQSDRDAAIQAEINRRTPPPVKEEKAKTDKSKK